MTIGGIIRIVVPQVAIAIGSTVYGGRAPTIVAALIIGALGAFFSFKGYVRRAPDGDRTNGLNARYPRWDATVGRKAHRSPAKRTE